MPATRQGWVTVGIYLVLGVDIAWLSPYTTPLLGSSVYSVLIPFVIITAFFIGVTIKKGEKPRWNWGLPDKYKDNH